MEYTEYDRPSLLPSSAEFRKARVLNNKEVAPGVFLLSLEKMFDFTAGQVTGIHFEPRPDARLYSIASGENEGEIRILFNIIHGGMLTPKLSACRPGDVIYATTPFGWFRSGNEPGWWIASGTGIAPFASMFYSGLSANKTLVHGGRTTGSFYFSDDLLKGMGRRYIRCCSGEAGEGLYKGRLTAFIEESDTLNHEQTYYLCGRTEMVVEVRDILLKRGISYNRIQSEIYF